MDIPFKFDINGTVNGCQLLEPCWTLNPWTYESSLVHWFILSLLFHRFLVQLLPRSLVELSVEPPVSYFFLDWGCFWTFEPMNHWTLNSFGSKFNWLIGSFYVSINHCFLYLSKLWLNLWTLNPLKLLVQSVHSVHPLKPFLSKSLRVPFYIFI